MNQRPSSTRDLRPSERRFVAAMQQIGFGRFEVLRIERGELVLTPWPSSVRNVKFCANENQPEPAGDEYLLKEQVIEFLQYVRGVDEGEIRCLEIRHGLPWVMEVECRPGTEGGRHHA